jgi:hypothetical protein
MKIRQPIAVGVAAVALIGATGCGGGGGDTDSTAPTSTASRVTGRGPIPAALRTVESASEDAIDLALAGKRPAVVAKARTLRAAAAGPVATALRDAGVSEARIADFAARADRVAELAPEADLLQVALASNHAFEAVSGFFALYESRVPAAVTTLDYLDFEAKLRAKAGDRAAVRAAVARLERTWSALRPRVVAAGGSEPAEKFDAHAKAMRRLAGAGAQAAAVREAQHGLDLVDELEEVYER